eukprot:5008867-Prymnesium_polylepis.1
MAPRVTLTPDTPTCVTPAWPRHVVAAVRALGAAASSPRGPPPRGWAASGQGGGRAPRGRH